MMGYYKNPEATAAALRDAWLHTGDLGYLDEDGFLYFVDRKKDIIKRGGENIASAEVERVLNSHPLVAESAAVAVPDLIRQEEVKACIVLAANASSGGPAAGTAMGILRRAPGGLQDTALSRLPAGTSQDAEFEGAEEPSPRRRRWAGRDGQDGARRHLA